MKQNVEFGFYLKRCKINDERVAGVELAPIK
ncbi:Uncharacterised protein [Legionella cherrii]|uniref:Uncharacterized protein n=1 Tax=Legionella cherrii TaxID=28084 RepID=A0ABY6TAB4_9GAMM|nr:Uncharacterised protein [Legionella cherrii]